MYKRYWFSVTEFCQTVTITIFKFLMRFHLFTDSDSSSDSDSDSPSKKKRKSSDDKTGKDAGKKDSRSHKNAADKENSRASKQKRKSLEREDNSESRSKSSGRVSRQMSEKNSSSGKNKNNIGDRLRAMAEYSQYGNIQNGDDRSRGRSDEDRLNRDVSTQRSEGRDRQDERGDHGYDVRNRENSERLAESGKKWNNSSERGVGRRDDNVGYGKRGEENRGQKTQRQDDYTSERRFVSRSAGAKKSQSEHDRENTKEKVSSESRRVFKKGEKGKEKRHDSSSEDSDSSLERVKKRSVKERSVSSSPEKRGSKRAVKTNKGGKKRQHKSDTSDSDSDSSDDSYSKSSKSKKAAVRKEKR